MIFPGLRLSQYAPLFQLILKTELHQLLILLDQIFKHRVCKVSPLDCRRLQNAVNLVLFFYLLIQMQNPSYGTLEEAVIQVEESVKLIFN